MAYANLIPRFLFYAPGNKAALCICQTLFRKVKYEPRSNQMKLLDQLNIIVNKYKHGNCTIEISVT